VLAVVLVVFAVSWSGRRDTRGQWACHVVNKIWFITISSTIIFSNLVAVAPVTTVPKRDCDAWCGDAHNSTPTPTLGTQQYSYAYIRLLAKMFNYHRHYFTSKSTNIEGGRRGTHIPHDTLIPKGYIDTWRCRKETIKMVSDGEIWTAHGGAISVV
jgi:hypothetical protein